MAEQTPAGKPDLRIDIDTHEEGRLIAYVNGHEVDVYANEDGVQVTLARDGIIQTAAELDWREPDGTDEPEVAEELPDPPDYLAEDAARRRFDIEHAAWMEEHGEEYERIMAELEAEHLAPLPEPEGPDMDTLDIG